MCWRTAKISVLLVYLVHMVYTISVKRSDMTFRLLLRLSPACFMPNSWCQSFNGSWMHGTCCFTCVCHIKDCSTRRFQKTGLLFWARTWTAELKETIFWACLLGHLQLLCPCNGSFLYHYLSKARGLIKVPVQYESSNSWCLITLKISVREESWRNQHPAICPCSEPLCDNFHPNWDPANINEVPFLCASPPACHEHGYIAAGQGKDEVEKAVIIGHRLEILHCMPIPTFCIKTEGFFSWSNELKLCYLVQRVHWPRHIITMKK